MAHLRTQMIGGLQDSTPYTTPFGTYTFSQFMGTPNAATIVDLNQWKELLTIHPLLVALGSPMVLVPLFIFECIASISALISRYGDVERMSQDAESHAAVVGASKLQGAFL